MSKQQELWHKYLMKCGDFKFPSVEAEAEALNKKIEIFDNETLRLMYDIYTEVVLPDFSHRLLSTQPISEKPLYIFLAGQPGAGKTFSRPVVEKAFEQQPAYIDADDLRKFHPLYDCLKQKGTPVDALTNPFTKIWKDLLVAYCLEAGLPTIQEGTFSEILYVKRVLNGCPPHALTICGALGIKKQWMKPPHTFQMWVVNTHPEVSYYRSRHRAYVSYEKNGEVRLPDVEKYLNGLYETLDYFSTHKTLAPIVILGRWLNDPKIDSNRNDDIKFGEALKRSHNRPLDDEEINILRQGYAEKKFFEFLIDKGQRIYKFKKHKPLAPVAVNDMPPPKITMFTNNTEAQNFLIKVAQNKNGKLFCKWVDNHEFVVALNAYLNRDDVPEDVLIRVVNLFREHETDEIIYFNRLNLSLFLKKSEKIIIHLLETFVSLFETTDRSYNWDYFPEKFSDDVFQLMGDKTTSLNVMLTCLRFFADRGDYESPKVPNSLWEYITQYPLPIISPDAYGKFAKILLNNFDENPECIPQLTRLWNDANNTAKQTMLRAMKRLFVYSGSKEEQARNFLLLMLEEAGYNPTLRGDIFVFLFSTRKIENAIWETILSAKKENFREDFILTVFDALDASKDIYGNGWKSYNDTHVERALQKMDEILKQWKDSPQAQQKCVWLRGRLTAWNEKRKKDREEYKKRWGGE